MKTKAVRLYGKDDLRLEEFELPAIKDDEILAKVVSDSICMSSYKATHQGTDHKRVPNDVAEHPIIIGHEFAGEIVEVGAKWASAFKPGDKFSIQPAMNDPRGPVGIYSAPGYSYQYIGGDATYVVIPKEVMENGCLLPFKGEGFYPASLSEPLSCVVGAMHACYHTTPGKYVHAMEIKDGGKMALLASVGPNTGVENPVELLKGFSGGTGYDDVFCFAPVAPVVEQADDILAFDGCLNFFAGPSKAPFKAPFNFYNVHYNNTHVVGTSGGNTDDMKEALHYMGKGMDPAGLVTHIGGLNAVIDTTKNLPEIPGGKKLIYTHIEMPLTAIADLGKVGKPVYDKLDAICKAHNGLWSVEAEEYLLENSDKL